MTVFEESEFEDARQGHRPFADIEWFASDESGHIAAFVTAGFAAIPLCAFDRSCPLSIVHHLIDQLPVKGGIVPVDLAQGRNPFFVELAAKGLFVYDWNHCSGQYRADLPYRVMTRPEHPIHVSELRPQNLLPLIPVTFGDCLEVVIEKYFTDLNVCPTQR